MKMKVREQQYLLAFALTDFKLQGRTLAKLILLLSNRMKAPWITLAAFYVFISRVRASSYSAPHGPVSAGRWADCCPSAQQAGQEVGWP